MRVVRLASGYCYSPDDYDGYLSSSGRYSSAGPSWPTPAYSDCSIQFHAWNAPIVADANSTLSAGRQKYVCQRKLAGPGTPFPLYLTSIDAITSFALFNLLLITTRIQFAQKEHRGQIYSFLRSL